MQTKFGLAISYNSHIPNTLEKKYNIPCNITYSYSKNIIQSALFHDLETLQKWRFSPGELRTWYNLLYLNIPIFREKIMKYQEGFVKCRKYEGIIMLKNFTFPQK